MDGLLWLGLFESFLNTYKDIKEMKIDQRFDYFMYGAIVLRIIEHKVNFSFLMLLIVSSAVLLLMVRKIFAYGDIESLGWMFLCFGIINSIWLSVFLVNFFLCLVFYSFLKRRWLKLDRDTRLPGMPILFFSFVLTVGEIFLYSENI